MLEIEHWKCLWLFGSAVGVKLGGSFLSQIVVDDDFSKWAERGGTGLSIILLVLALRYMRGKLEDREKRLDSLMDRDREIHEKATEARLHLAATMDKQAVAIDKLTDAIDRK